MKSPSQPPSGSFEDIERVAVTVLDEDWAWWPFVFLRPAANERLTSIRVAVLALLYGVFAGMASNVLVALSGEGAGVSVVALPASTTLAFFLVYRLTFARAWNRRAAKLAPGPRP